VLFTENDSRGRNRVMRIALSGGKPEPIGLDVDALSAFDISPDGTRIAYSASRNATEIWSLELSSLLRK
jgi:Tol biopolymer transport system component